MSKNVAVERIEIRVAGADNLARRIQAGVQPAGINTGCITQNARSLHRIVERRIELPQHAIGIRRLAEERMTEAVDERQVGFYTPVILCVVFELVVHDVGGQVERAL